MKRRRLRYRRAMLRATRTRLYGTFRTPRERITHHKIPRRKNA